MSVSQIILNIVNAILTPLMAADLKKLAKNKSAKQVMDLYGSKFVQIRFWDAPFIEVEKLVAKTGQIVDLGCGEGIFTNYLAASSPARKIIGVEVDKERFKVAIRAFKNVTFKLGDATKFKVPAANNIVMFHLLHHLSSYSLQERLINSALASLKKEGKLIIVEVNITPSLKYLISLMTDCFIVPWVFEHRFFTPVYFRRANSWKKLIEGLGYRCKITAADKGKPFSHVILECSR